MLRVVLAEDSVLLREGLIGLLERFGHHVDAGVGTAGELTAAVLEHRPDIVVTDVRMPPGFSDEGLRAAVELRERLPELPVLVLSQYVQRAYAEDLLDSCDGTGWATCSRSASAMSRSSSARWTGSRAGTRWWTPRSYGS